MGAERDQSGALASGHQLDVGALNGKVDEAVALFHAGQPLEASRMLRSVRRRAEHQASEPPMMAVLARTLLSESAAHFDMTGDLDAALDMLQEADTLATRVDSRSLQATVRGQRALVVLRSGDTRAALTAFDAAASLIDEAAPRDRAIIMLNRGVLHLEHTDLARAEADLTRSVGYAEEADDPTLAAMARHNLGYVDFLAGRLPRAIAAFEHAARTSPSGPHPAMQLDHARALREAGLLRDADQILASAAERVRHDRLFQDLAETELVRAECALAEGDPRRGRRYARSASRRFERRGNTRWQRKAELLLLRCVRAELDEREPRGRRRALLRLAERTEALAEACRSEARSDLARSAGLLAIEARLRGGGSGSAATPRVHALDPLPTRLQVREVRALAALRVGDRSRASAEVRLGLGELGSHQSALGSLDLRTAGAVHGVALTRLGLAMAVERNSPAAVLAMVERARAISTRLSPVRPPDDSLTARLLGELRQAEEEARSLEGDPDAPATVARLRSRATALQRDIRARSWQLEGAHESVTAAPRLSDVRLASRASGQVFVTFARHRKRWLAVVVRPSRATLVPLAAEKEVAEAVRRVRADLDALAMPHLPEALAGAVRGSLGGGLTRLDELLLAPLRVVGESLVLSCSGPLAVLPWTLLPSRSGLPTVVTPGAGTWLRGAAASRPSRPHVVALAGPGLHQSEHEAQAVAATWADAELLAGPDASTAAARSALARADLLHVAAHGTHRQDSPLFSSVRLADGPLYAYELDPADGVPAVVSLSACEAGLATLRAGDEGLGLTHVLLHLGVSSVLAGVARVRDDVAAETMRLVHAAMASGATSAEALATAQAELTTTQPHDPPAPFVTFGSAW